MTINYQEMVESNISGDEKILQSALFFQSFPNKGIVVASEIIKSEHNSESLPAYFASYYLSLIPGYFNEKTSLIKLAIENNPDLLIELISLIRYTTTEDIVSLFLERHDLQGFEDFLFEIAMFLPQYLQPYRSQISDEGILQKILPGSDDKLTASFLEEFKQYHTEQTLLKISWIKTAKAIEALKEIKQFSLPKYPNEYFQNMIDIFIECSGQFVDSSDSSIYPEPHRGFIVERKESPHEMLNDGYLSHVPKSLKTGETGLRIVTLDKENLPFSLNSEFSPSFYWLESPDRPEIIYIQITKDGPKGLNVDMGLPVKLSSGFLPISFSKPISLYLEPDPNKYGLGCEALKGIMNHHQVGGFPPFLERIKFPRCPICGKGMKFLVSVDCGMSLFGKLPWIGIIYGFWCEPCCVSATLKQL